MLRYFKKSGESRSSVSASNPSVITNIVEEQQHVQETVLEEDEHQAPFTKYTKIDLNELPTDPGERPSMEFYHPSQRDEIRRTYLLKGPCQPQTHSFQPREIGDDPKSSEHLRALDGAKERLSLFEANLIEEGSFDSAVNGCECVFHTGSPVQVSASDPQLEVIDPAVKGTLNILISASKVPSLKRVVLTLSIAAVVFTKKPLESGIMVDETWFSEPIICEQNKNWYALSKTLAEDAAVKFSKENGLELIGIHPGYVIGPFLQPTPNLAAEGIMRLIKSGKDVFPDGLYRLVDVRDVATAHILAFENPEANGRYLMVGYTVRSSEIMKILDKLYPNLGNFERSEDGKCNEPLPYNISKTRAEGLGIDFTSLEVTIKDTVDCLKEKNFLSF